jgi:hypothetical protein
VKHIWTDPFWCSDGLGKKSQFLCMSELLDSFVNETLNILERWVASGRVATLSGRLAETSQIESTEIQLCVELGVA